MSHTRSTYVALLRGINVGGNNTINMKELKICVESLGAENVRTYINSGNVLFDGSKQDETKWAQAIEKAIQQRFELAIPVIVRDKRSFNHIARAIPDEWTNDKTMRTDVLFLWNDVDHKSVMNEISVNPEVDTLLYIKGAVIWHILRANYNTSKLRDFIGTKIYKRMTARNVNTVRKLQKLLEEKYTQK